MFGDNLERIVAAIEKNYEADEIFFTKPGRRFPQPLLSRGLITELRRVLFPGYFRAGDALALYKPQLLHRPDAHRH